MRYPLSPRASLENSNLNNSPQQSGGGRVSSLRSAWENGLSPVNKASSPKRSQTVLPSAVRSQEKLRATQQQQKSWRSSIGSGQENTSSSSPVPAWRSTAGSKERSPVKHSGGGQENTPVWRSTPSPASRKQQSWRSSPSPYAKHEVGRSSGPSHNSSQKVASPVIRSPIKHLSSPGRLARNKSNDYIRKWNTIGSPGTPEVYNRSEKETIGSSCHATTEVYESKADKLSSSDHYLSGSPFNDDDIPNIKRTETADSPAMNKLRLDLDTMCSSNHTAPKEEEEEKYQTFGDKTHKKEEEVEEESSVHIGGQSVTTSGSSLVYSLEDTILGSQANSRKSKELIDVVERSLQQIALSSGSASVSIDDSTDNGSSNQLIASELIASTLAECRLLLQMSPPPTPVAINSVAERNTDNKVDISARFDSDRAIKEAPSAESDCSIDKLMRCPCCSQKFDETGNHAPLHSFACEHIVCKDCVFQSTRHSNSVRCPECGEKGAFDKTRPVVSKSYLRLIKKMGSTGSEKTSKWPNKEEDEIISIPSQIRWNSGIDSDAISLFSSVSGHAHTAKLAAHNKELTKLIDEDYVSVPSSTSRHHESDKSAFTINPKREDVLSIMSESHCYDGSHREEKSLISEYHCSATSSKSQHQMSAIGGEELSKTSVKSSGFQQDLGIVPPRVDEISPMPPQEPATPVSRAEYRFLQRKQKLAESLEKVNRILEKSKNKEMGKICEEASISSSRHSSSSVEERSIVIQEEVISNSVASSTVDEDESIASARDLQAEELVIVDHDEAKSVAASVSAISNISAENPTKKSIKKSEFDTTKADVTQYDDIEDELRDMEDDLKAKLNKRSTKERLKPELRVYTGPQPSPLPQNAVEEEEQDTGESESCDTFDHSRSKAELTVCTEPQPSPLLQKVTEKVQSEKKASPCESTKSNGFCFDPFTFGETPKAFEGNNVFRSDDAPVVEFDDFFRVTSSEDSSVKEHEGAFLIPQPQQKDKKHKAQSSSSMSKLTDANRCAQFLPSLDFSKHGFNSYDSPSARSSSRKSTNKKVKKKMQQYSNAKPKRLSQKVFKSFSRDADELSVTSGLSSKNKGVNGNQEWRFQETLPNPPSVGVKPTHEKETPSYAFSEASCSLSPSSDDVDMKGSLDALVTHKKGFHLKIRNKMRKKKH